MKRAILMWKMFYLLMVKMNVFFMDTNKIVIYWIAFDIFTIYFYE